MCSGLALLLTRFPPETELKIQLMRDNDKNGVFEVTQKRTEIYQGTLRLE